jgi:hypothetical protein
MIHPQNPLRRTDRAISIARDEQASARPELEKSVTQPIWAVWNQRSNSAAGAADILRASAVPLTTNGWFRLG